MSSLLTSHTENSFSSLCLWISGGDFDSTDFYCLDVRGRKSTRKLCIAVSKKNIYDHILYVCVCIHIYIYLFIYLYMYLRSCVQSARCSGPKRHHMPGHAFITSGLS